MDPAQQILLHILEKIVKDIKNKGCKAKTYQIEPRCWMISNQKRKRTVAFGHVPDVNDENLGRIIGAFEVNLVKLKWASAEGFTHNEMIDKDLGVFEMVEISEIPNILCP